MTIENKVVKLPTKAVKTLSNEVCFSHQNYRAVLLDLVERHSKKHLMKHPTETIKTLSNEVWFLIKLPRGFFWIWR
jgi:hypothetical protein